MLFDKGGDFLAFEKVIEETLRSCRMQEEKVPATEFG